MVILNNIITVNITLTTKCNDYKYNFYICTDNYFSSVFLRDSAFTPLGVSRHTASTSRNQLQWKYPFEIGPKIHSFVVFAVLYISFSLNSLLMFMAHLRECIWTFVNVFSI